MKNYNGKVYKPSNSEEGEVFMEEWCSKCAREECETLDEAIYTGQTERWVYKNQKAVCLDFKPTKPADCQCGNCEEDQEFKCEKCKKVRAYCWGQDDENISMCDDCWYLTIRQ